MNDIIQKDNEPKADPQQVVVLYHDNCLDGFGAAYAAWKLLGDNASYHAVQYGNPTPLPDINLVFGKMVYVLDFSYKAEQIVELESWVKELVIIDHHSGAVEELMEAADTIYTSDAEQGLDSTYLYIFDNNKCGAVLTWKFFHKEPVPQLLLHIQDGDLGYLWKDPDRCLPNSAEIRGALACKSVVPRTFEYWDMLISDGFQGYEELVNDGTILAAAHKGRCTELAELAYSCLIPLYIDGVEPKLVATGLAINATGEFANELGNQLAVKSGTFGAVWCYKGAGKYVVSLRSIGDFDVSIIAKYYGGGGHKNAAGFVVDKNQGQKLRLILQDISDGQNDSTS